MPDQIKLLLRLYAQPAAAMSAILDQGSLLFASLAVLAGSLLLPHWMPFSFYTPLLLLAVVYVPGAVLIALLLGRLGAFWTESAQQQREIALEDGPESAESEIGRAHV